MARINRFTFVTIAVLFHLIYIASIFDIYFVSPIVHGMQAFSVQRPSGVEAPAKRLVLIVGDGLRADKAFQSFPDPSPEDPNDLAAKISRPLMPFIRSKVEKEGTFGVSHTRMPTESRPGHVALIAGLYEDVSAVTTGWKLNPVDFDSVFNRSRHTWSWGSPDILPMFKEGAVPGRIYADTYSADEEDFTTAGTELDTWVFDKVEELFKQAATDVELDTDLRKDKNVFFLHLLGLDTAGHGFRPYSKEYLHNIKVVDAGVKKITELIDAFYDDGKTAYVFTADHGMSDYGSHGDGHPDNTRTPLVVWGSGVSKPRITKGRAPGHEDEFSSDWGFDNIARHDVAQADVAALMAYLAGLEFPVNSVGELPLSYIAADLSEQAEAAFTNAQGVLEMYKVKEEQKRLTEFRYRPYSAFQTDSIDERFTAIRDLISTASYEAAIYESQAILQQGLEGLRYLQTYDWLFLRALVTIGYLGWMAFALTTVLDLHVLSGKTQILRTTQTVSIAGGILAAMYSMFVFQHAPWTYYIYAAVPVVFWEEVYARREAVLASKNALFGHFKNQTDWIAFAIQVAAAIGLLELLVLSYFHREAYTAMYIVAIAWPFLYGSRFVAANQSLIAQWTLGCLMMSGFTLLPAMKTESSNLILLGGLLMLAIGLLYLVFEQELTTASQPKKDQTSAQNLSRILLGVQIGLIALAMLVTRSSILSLQAKKGLPRGNQIVGWLVLIISFGLPFLHRRYPNKHYLHRLIIIFLTFSPFFVLLTISYEGLFYVAFSITLLAWVRLEHHIYTFDTKNIAAPASPKIEPKAPGDAITDISKQIQSSTERDEVYHYRALRLSDARIALFFFFFIQSGFFSTGNVASISSFSLESVVRLIPVFDPFSQGALLMLKLMVPFAVISANLGVLNRRLGVAPSALFMVVMAISDVMTLNFFWMVRDEGSWLDIGTSISHFSIASMLCAFVALLEFVSEVFVSGVDIVKEEPTKPSPDLVVSNGHVSNSNGTATAPLAS